MPNHLAFENSPYLLQHADNPVDWYPWGSEALEKARKEDKPIFLSIGYAACHWCHVMAHESFEDPATAALMNEHFINIKVDREERPDLDSIYMQAVVAMTGQGGWPMSVFITPEGQPFFGGTYFPPRQRFNLPSFRDVLLSVARVWQEDRAKVLASSQNITHHMQSGMIRNEESNPLAEETLTQAAMALAQGYDWAGGGWGKAPKFPQPMAIEFLLRLAARGDKFALEIATHALDSMCTGGLYDVLGGGFARYSTDNTWLVPHFEKMLYDNAQLALVYLHAFLLTGNPKYRAICEETLEFITREMTHSEGGFYSSLDADSEGEEGKFYVWTPQQIRAAIGNPSDADFVLAAYGVTESGNFDGSNVLQRVLDDEALAGKFGLAVAEIPRKLAALHRLLLAERDKRIRPMTDDKILVFWNSLALSAFAEAGRYLGIQRYTDVAGRNARFLLDHLYQSDRLLRSWRDTGINQIGQARHNANLEDYAGLVLALLALYQTDPNPQWYQSAIKLAEEMIDHFSDPDGGFFDTRDDHEALILRPKDLQDNATPCGNALAATCLLQLAALENNLNWRKQAEDMLVTMQPSLARYPTAFSQWLIALDYALAPVQEVAIIGNPHSPDTQQLVAAIWSRYRPYLVYAQAEVPPPPGSPALLSDRPMVNDRATAYVCQNFTCTLPVNSPAELVKQLH